MPTAFVISGLVHSRDGDELTGLWVVVEERALPSRERLQAGPTILGRATPDREGRFRLEFEAPDELDVSFAVLDRDGRRLVVEEVTTGDEQIRVDQILFNAVGPLQVRLTVARGDRLMAASEYENLLELIGPDLGDLTSADLAEDDLDFLVRDHERDAGVDVAEIRQRLGYLRAADLLSRSTRLIGAAFYGWARFGIPDLWTQLPSFEDPRRRDDFLTRLLDELVGTDEGRLADTLRRAADAGIIPSRLTERADALAYAIRRRALSPVSVRLRLVADPGGQPLAAYTVNVVDGNRHVGADLTDALGSVTIAYDADPADPGAARELRLRISGSTQADPIEITARVVPPESEVKVPVPAPPDLRALVTAGHLQLSPGSLDAITAAGVTGYAEIRRRGGIADLANVDQKDARLLEALTEMDLLTPNPSEAATLIERNYRSVSAIAATPWGRFLAEVADDRGLPYERAVELRARAQAQVGMLDLLLAGYGSDLANGFAS